MEVLGSQPGASLHPLAIDVRKTDGDGLAAKKQERGRPANIESS